MRRRWFRRTALVVGLFAIFEVGDALLGEIAANYPGSGLYRFEQLKRGNL
jgi:hypothetical protein